MTNRDYALLAAKTLSDKKAQDIIIIDIQEKAAFADYFVICSGTSERQINSLIDDVEEMVAVIVIKVMNAVSVIPENAEILSFGLEVRKTADNLVRVGDAGRI